jgi:ubiquinone/menaquinone biosynthesis C-methylase UbiE
MATKSPDPSETGSIFASGEVAEQWHSRRAQRDELYGPVTERMLDLANLQSGDRVLDVAAGTGEQTLLAARRVGPNGYVLATDISASMLKVAAEVARETGLTNIETRVVDASSLDLEADSFDAVICRLGLMFFSDLPKTLREIRRVLKPRGKVAALVFSTAEKNPYQGVPFAIVRRLGGLPPPLFALAEPGTLEGAFKTAGFSDVAVHAVGIQRRFTSTAELVQRLKNAIFLRQPMAKLSDNDREQAWVQIEQELRRFEGPNGLEVPAEMLIGVAAK